MKRIIEFIKNQPPARLIALGFAAVILLGALVLLLPISVRSGVQVTFVDALFTSTSAVCVTGLIAIDTADHFTLWTGGGGCIDSDRRPGSYFRRSGTDHCGRKKGQHQEPSSGEGGSEY